MKWFTPSPFGRRHRFAFIAGAEKIRVLAWIRNGGWAIVLTSRASRSSRSNRNSAKWDWFRIHMMNKYEYNQFSLRKVLLEKVQYMHLYILAISHIFTTRGSLLRLCIIMLFQVWAFPILNHHQHDHYGLNNPTVHLKDTSKPYETTTAFSIR